MAPSLLGEEATKTAPLSRRERENLRQREEILNTALKLFSEKGYHNVPMHEIAKEAEFGIGTLYKYFSNKEELYKALVLDAALAFHRALMQTFEQEQDPIRIISKCIDVHKQMFSKNLPVMRLYFAETRGAAFNITTGLDKDIRRLCDEGAKALADVFEKGIEDRVFRSLPPQQMALALDGMIHACLSLLLEDPDRIHEEDILSTITDIFLKGVLIH